MDAKYLHPWTRWLLGHHLKEEEEKEEKYKKEVTEYKPRTQSLTHDFIVSCFIRAEVKSSQAWWNEKSQIWLGGEGVVLAGHLTCALRHRSRILPAPNICLARNFPCYFCIWDASVPQNVKITWKILSFVFAG